MTDPARKRWRIAAVAASVLMISGCDNRREPQVSRDVQQPAPANVAGGENDVRFMVAQKRIVDLERQVAELEAGGDKVEIELLKQRLAATEEALRVAAIAQPVPASNPTSAATPTLPSKGRPLAKGAPTKKASTPRPPLRLDL